MTSLPAGTSTPALPVVPARRRPGPAGRLPWRRVLTGAVVVTLVRPASWAVGLAGFLAGGGVVLVALPVVVLPTLTGIQNALGGPVSTLVVGTPSAALKALIVGVALTGAILFVAGLVIGAWAERRSIELAIAAAAEEGLTASPGELDGAPGVMRVAAVRLLSLVPSAVVSMLAWPRLYDAAYQQLILPTDLAVALPVRVARDVPWLLAAVVGAWFVSDAAAAIGVRRLVLERRSVAVAWLLGWTELARRPHRVLGTALAGLLVLGVLAVPGLVASAVAWSRVREVALDALGPVPMLVLVLVWVGIWLGALVLTAVGAAFRNAAWTLEATRSRVTTGRPGASEASRPG